MDGREDGDAHGNDRDEHGQDIDSETAPVAW